MYCLRLRKTQYLCGFRLDYYNATPTSREPRHANRVVEVLFYISTLRSKLVMNACIKNR